MSKYYVAAAIPYVNDAPHVGHALEAIVADVISRYYKLQGMDVFYSYGTDEHGGKIMDKAKSLNVSPKRYVDQISQNFVDLGQLLDIEYSKFIRTTDDDHKKRVEVIWKALNHDLYVNKYVGMYDQKEESFIKPSEAEEIRKNDPERFERLKKLEEDNYFFRLSKYGDQIKEAIETDRLRVVPKSRKNEMLNILEQGLEDISFSRPKSKIPWGIAVPDDPKQTIYVWVEALMNYITTLGYPKSKNFETFWPCDAHVIGKDITRFHAIIWPAMLLSLGLELPKSVYVHGMVSMDGKTMSKTLGNVVAPSEIVSAYGSDATRYFFLRHIPSHEDGDFSWAKFEEVYNTELGNDLGNLVQRLASMIVRYQDGVIGEMPQSQHDTGPYHQAFEDFRFDRGLEYVWTLIRGLNQYIDVEKPWQIAKEGDQEHLREVLAYLSSSILQIADLLTPFMPQSSKKIIQILGSGVVKEYDGPLYPKIHNYTKER